MGLVAVVSAVTGDTRPSRHELDAYVDPRVELISIVFRLSGADEYNQRSAASPYAKAVDAHFGEHRNHPAVRAARDLRSQHGIGFDAPMSFALHIEDTIGFKERIPFDQKPPRLDKRWPAPQAREFLAQVRDFAAKTEFDRFTKKHASLYKAAGKRMRALLKKRSYVAWFDSYFGARPSAKFGVIVSLLNGPANYGLGVACLDGKEEITPIIGATEFDKKGIPVFDDWITATVVHEFCHSYTNPSVDKYADQVLPVGERLLQHHTNKMASQGYKTAESLMNESFVRAVVVRFKQHTEGDAAAAEQIAYEAERGFEWVGRLSKLLTEYETGRDQYPTFDAFVPRIVRFFEQYVTECKAGHASHGADP